MKGDPSARMRFINWFLVAAATMAITLVAKPIQASWLGAFAVGVFVVAVLVSTVGAFWMMWVAFRRGDLAKVCVAAFVPFAFVWYYLKRARQAEREHFVRVNRITLSAVAAFMVVKLVAERTFGL